MSPSSAVFLRCIPPQATQSIPGISMILMFLLCLDGRRRLNAERPSASVPVRLYRHRGPYCPVRLIFNPVQKLLGYLLFRGLYRGEVGPLMNRYGRDCGSRHHRGGDYMLARMLLHVVQAVLPVDKAFNPVSLFGNLRPAGRQLQPVNYITVHLFDIEDPEPVQRSLIRGLSASFRIEGGAVENQKQMFFIFA